MEAAIGCSITTDGEDNGSFDLATFAIGHLGGEAILPSSSGFHFKITVTFIGGIDLPVFNLCFFDFSAFVRNTIKCRFAFGVHMFPVDGASSYGGVDGIAYASVSTV